MKDRYRVDYLVIFDKRIIEAYIKVDIPKNTNPTYDQFYRYLYLLENKLGLTNKTIVIEKVKLI